MGYNQEVSDPSITVSVYLSWVSFHTVEHTSVYSILSQDTILTKTHTATSVVLHSNSYVLRLQPLVQVTYHIHSIPYVVVFKCNLRNLKVNGFTKVPLTASARLLRRKVLLLFSRVQVLTLYVL